MLRSCANTGVVTLGASPTTGTYLLPRLIAVFRQRNPQVVVQLRVSASLCSSVFIPRFRESLFGEQHNEHGNPNKRANYDPRALCR